jgi:copper(I)-binding protein
MTRRSRPARAVVQAQDQRAVQLSHQRPLRPHCRPLTATNDAAPADASTIVLRGKDDAMLKTLCITALLSLSPLLLAAAPASTVQVRDAWMRATPPGAPTAAGYLTLVNTGAQADRLLSVTSEAAERVELHGSDLQGGVMRMRMLGDGLELPAGARVELAPSGTHLMFIAPRRPLVAGDTVRATLRFQHAAPQVVAFKVMPIGAMPPSSPHHDMPGMKM